MLGMKHMAGPLVALATLAGAQSAQALSFSDLGIKYLGDFTFASTVSSADGFWNTLKSLYAANGYASLYNSFTALMAPETAEGTNALVGGNVRSGTFWSGSIDFLSSESRITFASTSLSAGKSTVGASGSIAVPGPIAAAGLPGVLALMGFAAWKRRRAA